MHIFLVLFTIYFGSNNVRPVSIFVEYIHRPLPLLAPRTQFHASVFGSSCGSSGLLSIADGKHVSNARSVDHDRRQEVP